MNLALDQELAFLSLVLKYEKCLELASESLVAVPLSIYFGPITCREAESLRQKDI